MFIRRVHTTGRPCAVWCDECAGARARPLAWLLRACTAACPIPLPWLPAVYGIVIVLAGRRCRSVRAEIRNPPPPGPTGDGFFARSRASPVAASRTRVSSRRTDTYTRERPTRTVSRCLCQPGAQHPSPAPVTLVRVIILRQPRYTNVRFTSLPPPPPTLNAK